MSLADLEKKLAQIQVAAEANLAERIERLIGADLEAIRREAHRIRGAFPGRRTLNSLAHQLEQLATEGNKEGVERALPQFLAEGRRITAKATPITMLPLQQADGERSKRILMVDDDPAILRMAGLTLRHMGPYDVDEMEDAGAVMQRLSSVDYDLVILDAMMPDVGGIELALMIRESQPLLKVVLYSAAKREELGGDTPFTWWRKPLSAAELASRVQELLGEPKHDEVATLEKP